MKSKRRPGLIIFLLLLIGTVIFFLVKYLMFLNDNKAKDQTFILPRLEQAIIEVKTLTHEKIDLNLRMLLNNPLPFRIGADSIAYEFFIGDSSVLKTSNRQNVTLKGSDTSWIFLPITVQSQKLFSVLDAAEKNGFDSVYYEVHGSFYSRLLNDKKFNFHYGRMLPLFHPLEIEIAHVEIDSANFNRFKLLVHTKLTNGNVFQIETKDIDYRFAVAGNPWIKGVRPGPMIIPADTTMDIIFPVTVSLEEVGETVFTVLRKGRNISYSLEMNLRLISEKNMLNNSLITLTNNGTIKEIMQLKKTSRNKK